MPCASAVPGASAILAVGKPRPVARLAPPVTRPDTRHHQPSICAAPLTSPWASSARMAPEENTSPASATCATTATPPWRPPRPADPVRAPRPAQGLGVAAAALAEAEVVADDDVGRGELGC